MSNTTIKYLNKVLLKGRLGNDPDLRIMPSGVPICNFSMATRNGNHVEWHKIVAYEGLANYAKTSFSVGDLIYIEAEIRSRECLTNKDKIENRKPRKILELIAHEIHLLSKRQGLKQSGNNDADLVVEKFEESTVDIEHVDFNNDIFTLPKYI